MLLLATYGSISHAQQTADRTVTFPEDFEHVTARGAFTETGVEQLAILPRLRDLFLGTNSLDQPTIARLKQKLSLKSFDVFPSKLNLGKDGIFRTSPDDGTGRKKFDGMEGQSLETMLGEAAFTEVASQLEDKVVLVEFWGTWCGPCRSYQPELKRLHDRYHDQGFEILAIHDQRGADTAEDYLKQHPKAWPNVTDFDGEIGERFSIAQYPTVYLFDRDGRLQAAAAYRWALEVPIQELLGKE